MHIFLKGRTFSHVPRSDTCLLMLYIQTLLLPFHSSFFLYPCGSVLPHTESCIFVHHYCSALTCFPLSVTTYSSGGVMFPSRHLLLLVLQPNNQGRREHWASLLLLWKKGWKIDVGSDWQWNYPGVQNLQPFAVATPQKFTPLFQASFSSWASLLLSSCVGC